MISAVTYCCDFALLQYGKMADRCYRCQCQFGFLQRRHNCVICGLLACEKCSSHDLIVYIPDEDDVIETVPPAAVAKLAIIRILGVRACWNLFFHAKFSLFVYLLYFQ